MAKGEVVVVTGATAGVGRAVAEAFAAQGAKVGLLARGAEGLAGAERAVKAAGGEPLAVATDVADPGEVEDAAATVEAALGPIDVWVNDAMATVFAPVPETSPADFRRATEVTYLGAVYATMAALSRMVPRDRGTIVQVGSALSYRAIPLQAAYCGAKHALRGFTDSLRTELIHDRSHVRLTMVHLPALNTPQFGWSRSRLPNHPMPVPPIYQPEVAARAVLWAARNPRRREVWVGGPTVATILANRLAPRLLDLYLGMIGYGSQQTGEPIDPRRPDNLYLPVDEHRDHGAHGGFDHRAHSRSAQLWATEHRRWLGLAGAAALAAGTALRARG